MGRLSDNHIAVDLFDNNVSDRYANVVYDTGVSDKKSNAMIRVKLCTMPAHAGIKKMKNPVVDVMKLATAYSYKMNRIFSFSILYDTENISGNLLEVIKKMDDLEKHKMIRTRNEVANAYEFIVNHVLSYYGGCIKSKDSVFYKEDLFLLNYSSCGVTIQLQIT